VPFSEPSARADVLPDKNSADCLPCGSGTIRTIALPAFALTPGTSLTEDGRANFEAIQFSC
jgi:hypothetical protein